MTIRPDEPLSPETLAVREAAPEASGEPGVVPPAELDADPVAQPGASQPGGVREPEARGERP